MAYLLVTSGKSAGVSIDLKKCPLSIGRDVTQDIQLLDAQVSRKHLLVERKADDTYTITTQPRAKNGMLVNDNVVPQAVLQNGDRIRIGETEILFLATDQASQLDAIKRVRVWSTASTAQTVKRSLAKAK